MLEELAPNLFLQRHALKLAGCKMGRVVSIVRLESGKTVIHSTANFQPEHIAIIRELGEPGWLIEGTNFHDTFARAGRAALSDIPYLTPPGFKGFETLDATPFSHAPSEWKGELELIEICGMPKIREHVIFHRPSKTLIVADLLFNLPPEAGRWTLGFMRAMAGIREYLGMSRLYRFCIKERSAFVASMREIAALDFERIVVGHGEPIVEDAKRQFLGLMATHGFAIGTD
jgi:hypothetical protein